jgi:exopolysaccharide/PEP-CTERM locus tyrosine autokinase
MVTSALAGEGKSFTSVNLALSIAAELDNTVMLVDADVARPSVLRMLGLPQGPGLLDVLEERVDLSDVLLKTSVEKLTLLPSGTPHPRATELLASDAMTHLLDDMAKRYPDRIIIFDSPPLLLTTESRVLASHMGQVVVVVHAERTAERGAAGAGRHRDLPAEDDAAQPGQPQRRGRVRLWLRLRVWLRLWLWQQ